jgi:hypothetical protein
VTIRRSGATAILVAVMVGSLVSCQFQRRSADYACDSQADCSGGRVCAGGWCVESGDGGSLFDADPNAPDADPNAPDAGFVCPVICSRCESDTCVMDCALPDACAVEVVCPPGMKCRVECGGRNACGGGIDCSAASDCLVYCNANDTCDSLITCGPGPCRVNCTASATCTLGIDCADSCQCDTVCSGSNSCIPPPTCPSGVCTDIATDECDSSLDQSCRTCPQ